MGAHNAYFPSHPESIEWFENGDTIDPLLGGCDRWHRDRIPMGKRQIWDRGERGIEAGTKPSGVFVLDSKEEKYGDYYCKLMNPKFCRITEINVRDGWQIGDLTHPYVKPPSPSIRRERCGYLGTYRRRFQQQGAERVVEQRRMADERELTVCASDLERRTLDV